MAENKKIQKNKKIIVYAANIATSTGLNIDPQIIFQIVAKSNIEKNIIAYIIAITA